MSLKKRNFKTEEKELSLYILPDLAVFEGRPMEASWQPGEMVEKALRESSSGYNSSEDHDWNLSQLIFEVKSSLGGGEVN